MKNDMMVINIKDWNDLVKQLGKSKEAFKDLRNEYKELAIHRNSLIATAAKNTHQNQLLEEDCEIRIDKAVGKVHELQVLNDTQAQILIELKKVGATILKEDGGMWTNSMYDLEDLLNKLKP